MTCFEKVWRLAGLSLAAIVATVTLAVMAHAVITIKTPNAATFSYSLAPGASTSPTTPVDSQPVLVTGVQNTSGYRGVGRVALLRVPSSFLEWVGLDVFSSAITSGYSGIAGTHIVYLDYSGFVDLEVASTDSFLVHNSTSSPITATGNVTLVW
jgi:hypothetical protein